jgi:transglutaminase-like putative cysteine protease
MQLFEPKIYKKNGLEAFRLAGSDGSEFFYEGAIDCNDKELYKDALGRLYYPVIAEIGGAVKYYVELDPQVPAIPLAGQDTRDKSISRLVNASPRPDTSLPEDIFVKQDVPQEVPQEAPTVTSEETPQETSQDALPIEPTPAVTTPVPAAETPMPAPVEHRKSEEAASAIQAVFSPKADAPHHPAEEKASVTPPEPKKESKRESKKAEKASPVRAPPKAAKKRSMKWPLAIAVIVIVLLAATAIGVYMVKPGVYDPLRTLLKGSTPTPVPTATPTEQPSPEPTPVPNITDLIDSDSPQIVTFAQAHVNESSANDSLRQTCDLFDYVNEQWQYSDSYVTPRKASEITSALEGNTRDYTALMVALMRSLGIESRIVAYNVNGDDNPRYYPEVFVGNTSAGYRTATLQLDQWYGVASPQGHNDDIGYWIALSMDALPGTRPSDAITEYALSDSTISPLS